MLSILVPGTVAALAMGVGLTLSARHQAEDDHCSLESKIVDRALYERSYAMYSGATSPDAERKLDLGPAVACFAEGTPDEVVQAFHDAMTNHFDGAWPGEVGPEYQLGTRWNRGSQGDPVHLTWSFVPDGLSISSGAGEPVAPSNLFSMMDNQFSGNRALWISKFTAVFNRWSQVSGLTFERITMPGVDWDDGASWGSTGSSTRGDVRIAMKPIDQNGGILAYNYFPQNGDMVLDSLDISRWGNASGDYLQLRNVISHEHGHGQGISHVCPAVSQKLMEPFLATAFDGPQHDDMRATQRHYGDPYEPDNTAATANDLGTIAVGSTLLLGPPPPPNVNFGSVLSIDANGEQDWFKFTITAPASISITVTPIGTTYGSNSQNSGCTQTATVNSLSIADLAVQFVNTNGSTVIQTASGQPIGQPETITRNWRAGTGTYFVRVYESNTPSQSQLYHLSITVSPNAPPVLAPIGNKVGNEESLITFTASATDPDNGQTLTYSLVGAPAGASIDPASGVFTWTPTEAQGPGQYTFDVRVTDNGVPALSASETITVTVNEVVKTIAGSVDLQDFFGSLVAETVAFEFRSPGSTTPLETVNAILSPTGTFSFALAPDNLPAGVYDVTAKGSHWLRQKTASVSIAPNGASGLTFSLANGDIDGDNEIGIGDFSPLSAAFGTSEGDPGWNALADLNGDGSVDIGDFAILSSNFGMIGDD